LSRGEDFLPNITDNRGEGLILMKRLNNLVLFLVAILLVACTQGGGGPSTGGSLAAPGESVDFGESAAGERPGAQVSLDPGCDWAKFVIFPEDRGPFFFKPTDKATGCTEDKIYYQSVKCEEIPNLNIEYNPDNAEQCLLPDMKKAGKDWADCKLLSLCESQTALSDPNCSGCYKSLDSAGVGDSTGAGDNEPKVFQIKECNQHAGEITFKSSVFFNNGKCRLSNWSDQDWMDCEQLYSTCCDQDYEKCKEMPSGNQQVFEIDPDAIAPQNFQISGEDQKLGSPLIFQAFEEESDDN